MKRGIKWLLLFLMAGLCFSGTAHAAEQDGYIVKIEARPSLFSASEAAEPEGLEEIYAPEGLYQTGDAEVVERLREAGALIYAEPNYVVTLEDAGSDLIWGREQWYAADLGVDVCRRENIDGAGVRVGVVDSGLFEGHIDLAAANILPGTNYCVSEGSAGRGDTGDSYGHGTFISGLIAARARDEDGVTGLAPGVELVPLKCFNGKNGSVANIAAAIYGGVDTYRCQVLNLSFGLTQDSAALRDAVEYAARAGTVLVAACGNINTGSSGDDPLNYPAAYPQVIGVGAVDESGAAASFSSRNESVWITAPGSQLWSLSCQSPTDYVLGKGTSYAAAFVTASAALALSLQPELEPQGVMELLRETALDLGEPGYDFDYGYGRLNVGLLAETLRGTQEGAVYTPELGVTITVDAAAGTVRAVLSADWPGVLEEGWGVLALYSGDQMLACSLAALPPGQSVTLETAYSGSRPLTCRLFILDLNYRPARTAVTCDTDSG